MDLITTRTRRTTIIMDLVAANDDIFCSTNGRHGSIMAENGERGLYGTVLAIHLGKSFQFSVPA